MRILLSFSFLLGLSVATRAQSSLGLHWAWSHQSVNAPQRIGAQGVRVTGDVKIVSFVHASGFLERQQGDFQNTAIHWWTGAVGPKLIWRERKFSPFVYAYVGRSRVSLDRLRATSYVVEAGAGGRINFSSHWAWETSLAYTQTRHFELIQRQPKLVTGIRFVF